MTAPPITRPSASLFAMCVPFTSGQSKAAQSVSHHTISENDMALISAAEKPVSLAKRRASVFNVASLQVVFFNQTKIAGLQAVVVLDLQAGQIRVGDTTSQLHQQVHTT
ncbi:hypothetical protein ACYZUC_10155 [Pseudomonas sp. GT1P32]